MNDLKDEGRVSGLGRKEDGYATFREMPGWMRQDYLRAADINERFADTLPPGEMRDAALTRARDARQYARGLA